MNSLVISQEQIDAYPELLQAELVVALDEANKKRIAAIAAADSQFRDDVYRAAVDALSALRARVMDLYQRVLDAFEAGRDADPGSLTDELHPWVRAAGNVTRTIGARADGDVYVRLTEFTRAMPPLGKTPAIDVDTFPLDPQIARAYKFAQLLEAIEFYSRALVGAETKWGGAVIDIVLLP